MRRWILVLIGVISLSWGSQSWDLEAIYDSDFIAAKPSGNTLFYRSSDLSTHIFYGGDHLYRLYKDLNTGGWVHEIIDGDESIGSFANGAIGPDGSLHVSYYDRQNARVRYAKRGINDDAWDIVFIDDFFANEGITALCVDDDNTAHMVFKDSDGLRYLKSTNFGYAPMIVDSGTAPSLVCENGEVYLAYAQSSGPVFARLANYSITPLANIDLAALDVRAISMDIEDERKIIGINRYDAHSQTYKTQIYEQVNDAAQWVQWGDDSYGGFAAGLPSVLVEQNSAHVGFYDGEDAFLVSDNGVPTLVNPEANLMENVSIARIANTLYMQYVNAFGQSIGWMRQGIGDWEDEKIRYAGVLRNFWHMDAHVGNDMPLGVAFGTKQGDIAYLYLNYDNSWIYAPLKSDNDIGDPKLVRVSSPILETWAVYNNYSNKTLEKRNYGFGWPSWSWKPLDEDAGQVNDQNLSSVSNFAHDAVEMNDEIHSCFINKDYELFYVKDTGALDVQSLELASAQGYKYGCAIAVDSQEKIHITYTFRSQEQINANNYNYKIGYITNESDLWLYEELVAEYDGSKHSPQIRIDSKNRAIIGYYYENTLRVLRSSEYGLMTPRAWPNIATIALANGPNAIVAQNYPFDLLVDYHDKIHVFLTSDTKLHHAYEKSSGFNSDHLELGFFVKGMRAVATKKEVHLFFENLEKGNLIHASKPWGGIMPSIIMYLLN